MAEGRPIVDRYSTKAQPTNVYDARAVAEIHRNADTDSGKTAVHHSIGPAPDQAASGAHIHDGGETRQLLAGVVLTGAKAGNAALASVISALVLLGAQDNTT